MSATFATTRTCPFCGQQILLADCPIVATNLMDQDPDPDRPPSDWTLPSRRRPVMVLPKSGLPALAPSPRRQADARAASQGKVARRMSAPRPGTPLPRLSGQFAPDDRPARACSHCDRALPSTIDERDARVLVILGANRVGKSHFIGTAFTEAYRHGALEKVLGWSEFALSDYGGRHFYENFYDTLYRRGEPIQPNYVDDDPQPIVFDVAVPGQPSFSLVVHDLAGEVFADPNLRARFAPFLRAAEGGIFLADPRDNLELRNEIRIRFADEIEDAGNQVSHDQGAILTAFLRTMEEEGRTIPVAVALSKADLLTPPQGQQLSFLRRGEIHDEQLSDFLMRAKSIDGQVREYLDMVRARDLLRPARSYQGKHEDSWRLTHQIGPVTFHAVSALGAPSEDGQIQVPDPINVTDPLAAVLAQMAGLA